MNRRPRPPRLFLGSAELGALPDWVRSLPGKPRRAALVPTAATPLPDAPYVQHADDLLRNLGVDVERLELEDASPTDVRQALERANSFSYVVGMRCTCWNTRSAAVSAKQ
ncbi:Type 1 glutamine amidotransferase-like domain-containing protein [Spirillospora sp. NPDC049652]